MKRYQRLYEVRYDAVKKFDYFNRKYFNSEIHLNGIDTSGKKLRSSFVLGGYDPRSNEIYLQKNNLPDKIKDLILLHEMIHAFNVQKDLVDIHNPDEFHGEEFEKIRERINRGLSLPIPKQENLEDIEKLLDDIEEIE